MALPWLSLIDMLIDVANLAMSRKSRRKTEEPASKEGFDRDWERLEFERVERGRQRAERALKLELLRQTGDREIGRLRLMAGVALGSWIGTLFLSARIAGWTVGPRVMLGAGWLLLLGALSLSFAAQSSVGRTLARIDEPKVRADDLTSGVPGALAPWLIVAGLAVIGIAALMA